MKLILAIFFDFCYTFPMQNSLSNFDFYPKETSLSQISEKAFNRLSFTFTKETDMSFPAC